MFGSGRRYAWPAVYRCIDILPEPWTLVRGLRSKHQGPWSTDLEPGIADTVPSFKLRCSHLVDAEPGLLGMIAGSGSNWLEGVGPYAWGWSCLGPRAGDGMVDAVKSNFVCVSLEIQVPAPNSQRSPI